MQYSTPFDFFRFVQFEVGEKVMKTVLIHQAMLLSQQIGEHYWY